MTQKPMIVLTGPTAVGKTALSIELAKKINGAIISADSMQVYKYMDIGSAKVTVDEMDGIKPVSYTHLDVYKRQHIKRGNIRGRSITNDAALSADKRTI